MSDHHRPILHPHCHKLYDGLDSDDIGFPPIRIRDSTPDSPINLPNPPNKPSRYRHRSSSKQRTSPSPSPRLSSSRLLKKGLGDKNVLNTIQITVHQPKGVPNFPEKRSSECLDTADRRPSKRHRFINEDSDDLDWLKREIDDIKERITQITDRMRVEVDLKLDEILGELRQWSEI